MELPTLLETSGSQTNLSDTANSSPSPRSKRAHRARSKTAADREDATAQDLSSPKLGRKGEGDSIARTKSTKDSNASLSPKIHRNSETHHISSDFRSREDEVTSPKRSRLRSKSTNVAPPAPMPLFLTQISEERLSKSKQSADSSDEFDAPETVFDQGPPPPVNLPPPPVFYISSPPLSPRLRPLAASMMSDDTDLTSSNSTLGASMSSPVPTARRAGILQNWTQQMETDLVDVEIRLRRMKVEEEELELSILIKKKQLHELDLEIQRRQNNIEALKQATIGQLALDKNVPPPTLSTPGSRALGPTSSAVWRSLDPHAKPSPPSSSKTSKSKSSSSTSTPPSTSSPKSSRHAAAGASPKKRPSSPADSVEGIKRTKSSSSKSSASLATKSSVGVARKGSASPPPVDPSSTAKASVVSRSSAGRTKISPKTSDSSVDSKSSGKSSHSGPSSIKRQHSTKSPDKPTKMPSPAASPSTKRLKESSKSKSSPKQSRSGAAGVDTPGSIKIPVAKKPSSRPSASERSHAPSPPPEYAHEDYTFDITM